MYLTVLPLLCVAAKLMAVGMSHLTRSNGEVRLPKEMPGTLSWSVFQDVQGLIDLMGGDEQFIEKLDKVLVHLQNLKSAPMAR